MATTYQYPSLGLPPLSGPAEIIPPAPANRNAYQYGNGRDFAKFAGVVGLLALVGLLLPGRWGLYLMLWAMLAYSANHQGQIVSELQAFEGFIHPITVGR